MAGEELELFGVAVSIIDILVSCVGEQKKADVKTSKILGQLHFFDVVIRDTSHVLLPELKFDLTN